MLVLVEVLLLAVLPLWLFFDFLVLFIVLLLSEPEVVFWANTAVPESKDRPRAAIMIFFIDIS